MCLCLCARVFPEWKVDSEFITEHLNDALRLDAKLSSHPIEVDCPDANQINQVRPCLRARPLPTDTPRPPLSRRLLVCAAGKRCAHAVRFYM